MKFHGRNIVFIIIVIFYLAGGSATTLVADEGGPDDETEPCQEGMWQCQDGTECLYMNETCSGVAECPDASDESVELCGCLDDEFECRNKCIALMLRCDTVPDCDEGEDEENCETWLCPSSHFKCHNGYCIPSDVVCDFVNNCGDNSDEEQCDHRKCYFKEFRCLNGECMRPGLVCDGIKDCIDGSDEKDCTKDDFAVCSNGKMVHRFYWCDGWPDCSENHVDETQCGPCSPSEFLCPNGRCIKEGNVCDAQCDCADCADEVDCADVYTKISGVPMCILGVSAPCIVNPRDRREDRCIRKEFICDGYNHCYNGQQISDETGCDVEDCGMEEVAVKSEPKKFLCHGDPRCLPHYIVCDGKIDCLNGDDENNCDNSACSSLEWECVSGGCAPHTSVCDLNFDCGDRSDEMNCSSHECGHGFKKCATGQCLAEKYWCDFQSDCFDSSDEADCGPAGECSEGQFLCANGRQCILLSEKCIISKGDTQTGCMDNSHLYNCRSYECPPNMFKCRSGPCLNESYLCDEFVDCPDSWDDEDFCPFQCSVMAPKCQCLHLEADCSGLQLTFLPDIEPQINRYNLSGNNFSTALNENTFEGRSNLMYLDLSSNGIEELSSGVFKPLWRLRILLLTRNSISHLQKGAFEGLHNIRTLDIRENRLTSLGKMAFYGLSILATLDLSQQNLSDISPRAFVGLRNLTSLSLSYNLLTSLENLAFTGLGNLQQLKLDHNILENVGGKTFKTMPRLTYLSTDERRWCCLAPNVKECLPPPDEFSSCEDLMSNPVLRICIWVLGIISLLGNSFVIVWRILYASGNKIHSFLIVNLAIGDLLMGLYLLVIASVDMHFRGVYAAAETAWRKSVFCHMAGFCSTLSSELSVFTLTVITMDRLLVIKFPFNGRHFSGTVTKVIMTVVWVAVLLLAAIPLAPIEFFSDFYGRSGVCLALHITNEKPNGWQYAVFVFIVLNFISFAIIAISYILMYTAARTTQTAARDVDKSNNSMGKRMTLIVVTDAACWLPIIGLGIASLAGATVPPKVYAWVAVFVLPLNAAVNPVLYTLSTAPVRKGLKRVGTPILSRAGRYSSRHDPLVVSVSCSQWKSSFKSRITTIDNETAITHTCGGHKMSLTYKASLKDDSVMEIPSDDDWVKLPDQRSSLSSEAEQQQKMNKSEMYEIDKNGSKEEELVPLKVLTRLNQDYDSNNIRKLTKNQNHDSRYD